MVRNVDLTHRAWLGLNEQRARWRRTWSAFFRDWDVLICPAFGTTALSHCHEGSQWERRITVEDQDIAYNDLLFWPGVIGAYHLPATVAPIGLSAAGLPIGAQTVGPLHGDRTTIAVAALIEQAIGGFMRPPGW